MYTTLLAIAILILGILGLIICKKYCYAFDALEIISGGCTIIGAVASIVIIILLIIVHADANATLHTNIEIRNSLVRRCELIDSDYEDVSKSDLIEDIAQFNSDLYRYKYWQANPWTSWFYIEEIANTLDYIEYPDFNVKEE